MFLLGGVCFRLIGYIRTMPGKLNLYTKCFISACAITLAEFISGCILNLLLDWDIWDYSEAPFNFWGQICIPFTVLWGLLSLPAFFADKVLCKRLKLK